MYSKRGFTGISKYKQTLEVNIDSVEEAPPDTVMKKPREEEYESYFDINEEDERSGLVASQLPPLRPANKENHEPNRKRGFNEMTITPVVDLEAPPLMEARAKRLKPNWVTKKEEKPVVVTAVPKNARSKGSDTEVVVTIDEEAAPANQSFFRLGGSFNMESSQGSQQSCSETLPLNNTTRIDLCASKLMSTTKHSAVPEEMIAAAKKEY